MRKFAKISAVLAALVFALAFAGCNSDDNDDDPSVVTTWFCSDDNELTLCFYSDGTFTMNDGADVKDKGVYLGDTTKDGVVKMTIPGKEGSAVINGTVLTLKFEDKELVYNKNRNSTTGGSGTTGGSTGGSGTTGGSTGGSDTTGGSTGGSDTTGGSTGGSGTTGGSSSDSGTTEDGIDIAGITWVQTDKSKYTLRFNSDGTFVRYKNGEQYWSGTYSVDNANSKILFEITKVFDEDTNTMRDNSDAPESARKGYATISGDNLTLFAKSGAKFASYKKQ